MDEWVPLANFNLDTVCPPEPPEPGEGGRTRGQKRKVDDDHRWPPGGPMAPSQRCCLLRGVEPPGPRNPRQRSNGQTARARRSLRCQLGPWRERRIPLAAGLPSGVCAGLQRTPAVLRQIPALWRCPSSLPRSEEEGEGHEDFDPQQLREHEEFTKAGSWGRGRCPSLPLLPGAPTICPLRHPSHRCFAAQRRRHACRLQVKNIEKIELGRFEMETWYYSPFPPEYRDCKVGHEGPTPGVVWGKTGGGRGAAGGWS